MRRERTDSRDGGRWPVRGKRERGASSRRAGGRRLRLPVGLLALIVLIALLLGALGAQSGLASSGGDGGQQAPAAPADEGTSGSEEGSGEVPGTKERENRGVRAIVSVSCSKVEVKVSGFPDLPGNSVTEVIAVFHNVLVEETFKFDGPNGENTTPIYPVGNEYQVDVNLKWNGNGIRGSYDIPIRVNSCKPAPAFLIEKKERIAGTESSFTAGPRTAEVGQTVEYKIVIQNTGNQPLTISEFSDPHCDPGTIAGGPGTNPVKPGGSSAFECSHVLTPADGAAGSYTNIATATGTPPEDVGGEGESEPITETSNQVEVQIAAKHEKEKEKETSTGGGTPPTTTTTTTSSNPLAGLAGITGASPKPLTGTVPAAKSGVLPFSAAKVPALNVPQGCVRSGFLAYVKSTGVKTVTFYLDGHKLKALTAKSARRGKISVTVQGGKLKVGAHKLRANITMTATSSSGKHVQGSRTRTVVRCRSAAVTPKFTG